MRPWLIGTVCLLAGVVSHVFLNLYVPIWGRAQMASNACFEGLWFGAGVLLLLVDAGMEENAGLKAAKLLYGILSALAGLVLACGAMPP